MSPNTPVQTGFSRFVTRSVLVRLVALLTFGSGLLNLYSVIGPPLPGRMAMMREIFPLEFLNISRFLTVLIGFALVISSLNVYRRKLRAFESVLVLSVLSIVFHLAKSLDYEQAFLSLFLVALLLLTRKHFTVKSGIPDLRRGLVRFGLALVVAFAYGTAGFWLLDTREFGINFTIGNSIGRTLNFLTLQGDPEIVPHTRYAHWFLNSLYLMTATSIGYALFALFRPVLYRYRTHPREQLMAQDVVARYGHNALDFFKYWPDKSFFFNASHTALIAYGVGGNYALGLGDPVGPEEEIEPLVRDFRTFCRENGWGVGFHQTTGEFLPVFKRQGFRRLKIGDDAIVDLAQFSLQGGDMKPFRHRLNRLEKEGVHVVMYEPPLTDDVLHQAREVSEEWLQVPGRRERGFTLGLFEPGYVRSTPLFGAADRDDRLLAFLNVIPSFRKGEATVDLMRHRLRVPNGIMDYLFVKHILRLREQGFERFNMGMAPMSGFQEKEGAMMEERAIHYFVQHLNFLFSFTGLRNYKAKFATSWEPRYSIYQNPLDLPRLALALSRVSELT